MNYAEIVAAYEQELPYYEELARYAEEQLRAAVDAAGIYTTPITARAKEPSSFGIKATVGRKYERPLEQITDKAGARVTVFYERDVEPAVDVVKRTFQCVNVDRKLEALAYDQNGYLGTHLDVQLRDAQVAETRAELAGRTFEVQVRTMAQSAWAEVSHAQLYKPPADVPATLKRRIYRLVALVELFDSEVESFRAEAARTEGYREAAAVRDLNVRLAGLGSTRAPNRQLTLELAAAIVPLYRRDAEDVRVHLDAFVTANDDGLRNLIREAEALPARELNPLLMQPELPMICERLGRDRISLEQAWPSSVPLSWLNDLAEKWGLGRAPD